MLRYTFSLLSSSLFNASKADSCYFWVCARRAGHWALCRGSRAPTLRWPTPTTSRAIWTRPSRTTTRWAVPGLCSTKRFQLSSNVIKLSVAWRWAVYVVAPDHAKGDSWSLLCLSIYPCPPLHVQALGLRPEDVFTGDMLALAMEEDSERFMQQLRMSG